MKHGYGDQDVVTTMSAAEPIVATRAAGSTAVQSVHLTPGPCLAWQRLGPAAHAHALAAAAAYTPTRTKKPLENMPMLRSTGNVSTLIL